MPASRPAVGELTVAPALTAHQEGQWLTALFAQRPTKVAAVAVAQQAAGGEAPSLNGGRCSGQDGRRNTGLKH